MRIDGDMPASVLMHCDDESINELTHWGVRGMRWGVRRYQNKDGSLTPAGKKRYDAEVEKLKAEEKVIKTRKSTQAKIDKLNAKRQAIKEEKEKLDIRSGKIKPKEPPKKTLNEMSDDEVIAAINRKRLEETYKQLHPEPVSKGKKFVNDFVDKAAIPGLQEAGKTLIRDSALKVGKKWLGLDVKQADDYVTALGKEVKKLALEKQYEKFKEEAREAERAKQAEAEAKSKARKEAFDEKKHKWAEKIKSQAEKRAAKRAENAANRASERDMKRAEKAAADAKKAAEQSKKAADKAEKVTKESEPKVVFGEFVGDVRKNKSYDSGKKTTYDIIDVYDYTNVSSSGVSNYPATRRGESYISGLLPSPNQLALRKNSW